jgi:serine/threonine protein kinase
VYSQSSTFILKTLKAYIEPDSKLKFEDELNCLGTFRRLKHPNIVELLFSFTYLGEYHMIFPQYPLDLAQFLKLEEPPGDFRRPQAFCEALSGLASAISSVHNVKLTPQDHEIDLQRIGYHHDLRPANVLVSHNSFLLADFGLARIKEIDKGSKTNFKETKGDYFAPECQDQNFANQIVGRPVDIWAFGCMVVEMVTYLQRGATGVQEARVQRSAEVAPGWTDCRFYHGNCLRPAVEGHIHDLESENDVSREVVCLLQIAKLMLSIDVDQRPKADKVSQYMAHVAIKSQFHATQASVAQYLEIIDNDQSFEVPSLELWFISNKLGAWGQVLGLSDSQIDTNRVCYPVGVTEAMNIDLRKLESIFQVALHDQIWTRTGMDGTSAQYDLQEESRTTMEGLIQRLEPKDKRSFESVCRSVMLSQTNLKNTSRYGEMPGQQEPDYGDLAAIAEVKQLYDVFERLTEIEPSYITLLLDERCLRGIHPVDGHEFGYFRSQLGEVSQKQEVLVERVAYSAKWKEQSYEEKVTKIASLAKLLNRDQQPIGFRFLRCLGVILSDTDQAYKFLFELPGDESQRRPKSLYSLFLKNSKSWNPDLQQRLRLAQGIVLAVEALHTIGWLHKALHPHNILFFHPSTDALETLDLAEFYITNFRMSRPDGMTWVSEGPDLNFGYRYQHPYYIRKICVPVSTEKR